MPVSGRDHAQGAPNAEVTLVMYGDYECRHSNLANSYVKQLQKWFGAGHLRFVFRHFPVSQIHPYAERAAEAAEAAGAQGRFWEMHDSLFFNQKVPGDERLVRCADALNLDVERLMREVAEGIYRERVCEDFLSGVRCGVNGTPTFFVNGARYDGSYDFDSLLAAVEDADVG